jgi:hypothetical protein
MQVLTPQRRVGCLPPTPFVVHLDDVRQKDDRAGRDRLPARWRDGCGRRGARRSGWLLRLFLAGRPSSESSDRGPTSKFCRSF